MENINTKNESMRVIPMGERKCIWMDSGVVSYKLCTNQFQCFKCEFDQAMSNRAEKDRLKAKENIAVITPKKSIVKWMDEFRNLPADQRKCRYMLMGEVSHKICPNSFRCGECTYDQMMQDRLQPTITHDIKAYPQVSGFYMPENLYYFRNHMWLHLERMGKIRIGLDDFARRLIGQIKSIELPATGKEIAFEEYALKIHHDHGDLELFSPIEGVVESTNQELLDNPMLVNEKPYNDGWLMTIDPKSVRKGIKNLLNDDEASKWMTEEAGLLSQSLQAEVGVTLQDGAVITDDISKNLTGDKWNELVKKFLYTR